MNTTTSNENTFVALREKELTRYQLLELTWAMKELAEAIGERYAWDTLRHTTNALRYINEFRGNILPTPELTKEEANMSANLHTYMRKLMDCPLGTMLYALISENRGTAIWYVFVNAIVSNPEKNKVRIYEFAMRKAEEMYKVNNTTDDLFMLSTLRLWEDDFPNAMTWAKGEYLVSA